MTELATPTRQGCDFHVWDSRLVAVVRDGVHFDATLRGGAGWWITDGEWQTIVEVDEVCLSWGYAPGSPAGICQLLEDRLHEWRDEGTLLRIVCAPDCATLISEMGVTWGENARDWPLGSRWIPIPRAVRS